MLVEADTAACVDEVELLVELVEIGAVASTEALAVPLPVVVAWTVLVAGGGSTPSATVDVGGGDVSSATAVPA